MKTYVITGVGRNNSLANKIIEAIVFDESSDDYFIVGISHPNEIRESKLVDFYYTVDLSIQSEVEYGFGIIKAAHPQIDVFINCAGMNGMAWFGDVVPEAFRKIFEVNFFAPVFASQILLPSLTAVSGTILNIISMGAHKPFRTSLAYNTSKAALKMATEQIAREITPKFGVTCFGISPNELEGTGLTLDNYDEIKRIRGWNDEDMKAALAGSSLTGERTDPRVLAEFIAFLLERKDRHAHMSGVDIYYGN